MQVVDFGVEEHPDGKLDALHVPVGSLCEDFILSCLHIVDYGLFYEGDLEVEPFPVDLWGERAGEFVELDGVVSDVDCIGWGVP